ncbi:inositol-3-phosphate synthase [Dictyocaulus viviparus]|uniref:Inositol-3-phosphate synthase n=1 Tax=Dictyocaulus viviparus TaxID=29172 RepID=A0A0D8Y2L5_DICVI|nr:inositol-3-phosphate synthase [Dictyocaulus viviparus]
MQKEINTQMSLELKSEESNVFVMNNSTNESKTADYRRNLITVDSPYVRYNDNEIESKFLYRKNHFCKTADGLQISPKVHEYVFKTKLKPQKTGVLLVGIGGNNGSTTVGAMFANKMRMTWRTKEGIQMANYFGSITQTSTVHLGWDGKRQIHVPFNEIIPILSPNDLIFDGWDINNQNLFQAMVRAKISSIYTLVYLHLQRGEKIMLLHKSSRPEPDMPLCRLMKKQQDMLLHKMGDVHYIATATGSIYLLSVSLALHTIYLQQQNIRREQREQAVSQKCFTKAFDHVVTEGAIRRFIERVTLNVSCVTQEKEEMRSSDPSQRLEITDAVRARQVMEY